MRAVAVLAALLALPTLVRAQGSHAAAQAPGVSAAIEPAPARPYAFCRARLSTPRGLSGQARLYGIDRAGTRYLLFEAREAYAEELWASYYAWPELIRIELEASDGLGRRVGGSARPRLEPFDEELSLLPFPFRETPWRSPPTRLAALDSVCEELAASPWPQRERAGRAAALAQSRLFSAERRPLALLALICCTALALASAVLAPRLGSVLNAQGTARGYAARGYAARGYAAIIIATLAFSTTAFLAARPKAATYELRLPGAGASAPRPRLVRSDEATYTRLLWSSGAADGRLSFLGFHAHREAAIPLSVLDGFSAVRFSSPPTVTLRHGAAYLAKGSYRAAWGRHE